MTYELINNGPVQQHFIQVHEVDWQMAIQELEGREEFKRLMASPRMAEKIALLAMVSNVIELRNAAPHKAPIKSNGSRIQT